MTREEAVATLKDLKRKGMFYVPVVAIDFGGDIELYWGRKTLPIDTSWYAILQPDDSVVEQVLVRVERP